MARSWFTGAPPRIAGNARIGNASAVEIWSSVDVPKAAVASPVSMSARRSIETVKAVAVAPPPGRILPANWNVLGLIVIFPVRISAQSARPATRRA